MRNKIEKNKILIVFLLFSLVAIFSSGCSSFMNKSGLLVPANEEQESQEKIGSPNGLEKFFIGFKEKPGPAEQAVIHSAGGQVNFTYHIVNVIAASLPEKAIEALKKNPKIQYIEPDIEVSIFDTELDNAWGVKRIGSGLVHDSGNKGAGIKVAVIDTGIDYSHPDLYLNYRGGYDFYNNDGDPMDDHGHGTHVAGTIAALDDGIGVVGVAPEAELYALKVLSASGSGSYSAVIAALEWCIDNGIRVTNNSYGSAGDAGISVKNAFDKAYYNYGIINVSSAGNSGDSGDTVTYPARYDSVIAVAATDKLDRRTSFSSTGPDLELAAPGNSIYSTLIGGNYGWKTGTSMASPHVAGTVALMIAAGVSDVRGQLWSTAIDLGSVGWDDQYGYGLVNAAEAVGGSIYEPLLPPEPSKGSISGKVNSNTGLAIAGAEVFVEGTSFSALTDTDGNYRISDIAEGSYIVTASANGYESSSQNTNVVLDAEIIVHFELNPIPAEPLSGNITGKVFDATNGDYLIEGAVVMVEGTSLSDITDANGYYEMSNVLEGIYTVSASAEGYESTSKSVTVSSTGTESIADFELNPILPPPAAGKIYVSTIEMTFIKAVAGKNTFYTAGATVSLVDEQGNPVEGATVSGLWSGLTIGSSSGVTTADGIANFQSSKVKNPKSGKYFTFTIENIVKEGWEYIPNTEKISGSISIP